MEKWCQFFVLGLTAMAVGAQICRESNCPAPRCSCFDKNTPRNIAVERVPQFVMLTFDDAVTVLNYDNTYKKLFLGEYKNKANGCNVAATFFVTHEYTDYQLCHELHRHGNEMAVHSITHEASTEMWKSANYLRWKRELNGMKQILSKFARIDEDEITGQRAPFLQTAGDVTFDMLSRENFEYDSSMPTLNHMGSVACQEDSGGPLWPYTLDYGYIQDCQIQPCPEKRYKGLWEVPLVSYSSVKNTNFKCSMADACTPYPETEEDTFDFFKQNFERHYQCNRAPFPVFLHEAWLRHPERQRGYFKFVEWLLEKDDVFLVTVQNVLEYIKNPVELNQYQQARCVKNSSLSLSQCPSLSARNCEYKNLKQFYNGTRYMKSCDGCPSQYPWLEKPLGE